MRALILAALAAAILASQSAIASSLNSQEASFEPQNNLKARAALGVKRGSYVEASAGSETKTEGVYAFPQASFGLDFWRGREGEPAWRFGFSGAVAHVNKLNNVNFPVSWSGMLDFTRKDLFLVGPRTRLSPGAFIGGETFSQSSPDHSLGAGAGALTTRTTTIGKAGPKLHIASEAVGQPFELDIGLTYLFSGTTRVSGAPKSDAVQGLGADVKFVFWFTEHMFTNVLVTGSRLMGTGPRITGTSAAADIGWQF